MMNILVIAATGAEIGLSIKHIATLAKEVNPLLFELDGTRIQFAVTGVGMVATSYHLTRLLAGNQFDLVIQAGIAGSFDRNIKLGEVVFVRTDRFAGFGAEDGDDFIDIHDLGLIAANEHPFSSKELVNPYSAGELNINLTEAAAITVTTVTGSEQGTRRMQELYNCTLETMEGAAFHYVCLREQLQFIQVRAISNYVERRNRPAWKIGPALENLDKYLVTYLNSFNKS